MKPIDEQPPMEKPLFPVDGGVSIFPGEEGPEEEMPADKPKHPHHGWKRRQHATGEDKSPMRHGMEKMMSMRDVKHMMIDEPKVKPLGAARLVDRSRFRGGRGRNFKRRFPRKD